MPRADQINPQGGVVQATRRRPALSIILAYAFVAWLVGRLAGQSLVPIAQQFNEWFFGTYFRARPADYSTFGSTLGTAIAGIAMLPILVVGGGVALAFFVISYVAWGLDRAWLFPVVGAGLAFVPDLTRSLLGRVAGALSFGTKVVLVSAVQVFTTRGFSNRFAALSAVGLAAALGLLIWFFASPSVDRDFIGAAGDRSIRYLPTSSWQPVSVNTAWRFELIRVELLRDRMELTLRCTNRQRKPDQLGFTRRTLMREIDSGRPVTETFVAHTAAGDVAARGLTTFGPGQTREVVLHVDRPQVFQHRWRLTLGLVQDRGRTLNGQMVFDLRKKSPRG